MSTTTDWTAVPQPAIPQPALLPSHWTVADLQEHLGGVPSDRIRLFPAPGTATEADVLSISDHEDRLCELIDGVLVEKAMASFESLVALMLGYLLHAYLEKEPRGVLLGADGMLRILPTKIRIPDLSFISRERFPGGKLPKDPVYKLAPDLAVEIISEGNTEAEMNLKLREYFEAGARLVWYIAPSSRTARVFTAVDQMTAIGEDGTLDGQDILLGFKLRLGELFDRAHRAANWAE